MSVIKKKPVFVSMLREEMVSNFPYTAIRELVMNACMHRDLQSNMPLRIYEFAHHLEITNAGGLYGNARPENFPTINDYRNPLIASAMKTMGYVNMFNRGVGQVQADLKDNGNPPAEFVVNLITAFRVNVTAIEDDGVNNDTKGQDVGKDVGKELAERQKIIIEMIVDDPTISAKAISEKMSEKDSVNVRTIERDLARLKEKGILTREGGRKEGRWVICRDIH